MCTRNLVARVYKRKLSGKLCHEPRIFKSAPILIYFTNSPDFPPEPASGSSLHLITEEWNMETLFILISLNSFPQGHWLTNENMTSLAKKMV